MILTIFRTFLVQLISKCPIGAFKSTKNNNKCFVRISAIASKKEANKKKDYFIPLIG